MIIGEINCQPLKFLIDTGAGVTLISKGIFQQLSQGVEGSLLEVPFDVCGADGSQLEVLGKDLMEITIGPLKVLHEVIVADIEADAILRKSTPVLPNHHQRRHCCPSRIRDDNWRNGTTKRVRSKTQYS